MILNCEDDNEQLINKQNAKLTFLLQENDLINQDLVDLRKALELNKQALKIAIDKNSQTKSKTQLLNSTSTNQAQEDNNKEHIIIQKMNQECLQLSEALKRVQNERNQANRNLLLQQQINQETENFFTEVITELEDKILELRRNIQDKEFTVQQLEKKLKIPDKDKVLCKIKEVITPNEQSLFMHNEIEVLKEINNKFNLENQRINLENRELKQIITNMKFDLTKMKTIINNPFNYFTIKQFIQTDTTTKDDLDIQVFKRYLYSVAQQQFTEQEQKEKQEQFSQKKFQEQQNEQRRSIGNSIKTSNNPLSRQELLERITQLEVELANMKKVNYKIAYNNQQLQRQKQQDDYNNKQLAQINEKLIIQNNTQAQKLLLQFNYIQYQQMILQKVIPRQQLKRKNSLQLDQRKACIDKEIVKLEQLKNRIEQQINDIDNLYINKIAGDAELNKKDLIQQFPNQQQAQQQQQQLSQSQQLQTQLKKTQFCYSSEVKKEQCIQLLYSINNDLQEKFQAEIKNQWELKHRKHQQKYRSLSNPLDYYNFTSAPKVQPMKNTKLYQNLKKNELQSHQLEKQFQINNKLTQQYYQPQNVNKGNQLLDLEQSANNMMNNPFSVDMSVIDTGNMKKQGSQAQQLVQQGQLQQQFKKRIVIEDASFISNDCGEIFNFK